MISMGNDVRYLTTDRDLSSVSKCRTCFHQSLTNVVMWVYHGLQGVMLTGLCSLVKLVWTVELKIGELVSLRLL